MCVFAVTFTLLTVIKIKQDPDPFKLRNIKMDFFYNIGAFLIFLGLNSNGDVDWQRISDYCPAFWTVWISLRVFKPFNKLNH